MNQLREQRWAAARENDRAGYVEPVIHDSTPAEIEAFRAQILESVKQQEDGAEEIDMEARAKEEREVRVRHNAGGLAVPLCSALAGQEVVASDTPVAFADARSPLLAEQVAEGRRRSCVSRVCAFLVRR